MALLSLPNELLQAMCEKIVDVGDISRLSKTCWRLFQVSVSQLYRCDHLHNRSSAIPWALKHDRVDIIRRVIESRVDIVTSRHLTLAAELGRRDLLWMLWDYKAKYGGFDDLNRDAKGRSPFLTVVAAAMLDVAQTFLSTGQIDIENRNSFQDTALIIAAHNGDSEMVKLLLQYKADIASHDKHERSPLAVAAAPHTFRACYRLHVVPIDSGDHLETVKILLAHGAAVDHKDSSERTALLDAAQYDKPEIVELLAAYRADVNTRSSQGYTPLHQTSLYLGKLEMTKLLVRLGADVNALNVYGRNPLFMSKNAKEPVEVAQFLLRSGAQLVKDTNGDTLLHSSASHGIPGLLKVFLAHGADVNATNNRGDTALHYACQDGEASTSMARVLIKHGADVNAKNHRGEAALGFVVDEGPTEVVQLLLQNGADPESPTRFGTPALHEAVSCANIEATRLLLQYGADPESTNRYGSNAMHQAARVGSVEVMQLLVKHGASVHAVDADGCTVLMTAVSCKRTGAVEWLIGQGVSLHAADRRGRTALHEAGFEGGEVFADMLLRAGADVNSRNSEQQTPLHVAAKKGCLKLASILLDSGADAAAMDSHDNTAFQLARNGGQQSALVKLFCQRRANCEGSRALPGIESPAGSTKQAFSACGIQ